MGYNVIEKRSDDVTNTKFVKLWDRLVYPKRTSQEKNVQLLPKISLFVHLAGVISIMFRRFHINPSRIGLDRKLRDPSQFQKDSYGVIRA